MLLGVGVVDDDLSNNKTSISMPSLPLGATKFVYVVSIDSNPVTTPNIGDDWSANAGNTLLESQANIIVIENRKNVGIAALDSNNFVVQFVNVAAISEVEPVQVPLLTNGLSFSDDNANDTNTIINLGVPSATGNTFVFKISDNANAVPTPKEGDDLSSWTPVVNGASITVANGKHIGVAEVDGNKKAVQFSDAMAVTEVESSLAHNISDNEKIFTPLTQGYASGSQEGALNVTVISTGENNNISATLSGTGAVAFDLVENITNLTNGASGVFAVRAKDGLTEGTYTATIKIQSNEYSSGVSFTVTQVVNAAATNNASFTGVEYSLIDGTITVTGLSNVDATSTFDMTKISYTDGNTNISFDLYTKSANPLGPMNRGQYYYDSVNNKLIILLNSADYEITQTMVTENDKLNALNGWNMHNNVGANAVLDVNVIDVQ